MPSKPGRSESSIQAAVVKHARALGMLAIKQSTMARFGTAGWPDYLFITERGRVFWIEFKREGNRLTPLQQERARDLEMHGQRVYMVDNVALGDRILLEEAARVGP